MKIKLGDSAVSEIVGAIFLLAIAICFVSFIYIQILSNPGPSPETYVTIVGKLENNNVVFEFRGGESLGLDTSVVLNIGGTEKMLNLSESDTTIINNQNNNDKVWNIGERFVFGGYDLRFPKVEGVIIDKYSNSIVWWGILKPGGIYSQLGARWYFDENCGDIAYDSLNENDGRLIPNEKYGPQWDSDIKYNGSSSLRFNGGLDSVFVPGNTISLDIVKNLSIEAYVKFPENKSIDNSGFGKPFGHEPNIIHVCDDIYAIAYQNMTKGEGQAQQNGVVQTVNLTSNGWIRKDIDNIIFEQGKCFWPKICNVYNNIFIVAYADSDVNPKNVTVKTLEIQNNGTTGPLLGSYSFDFQEIKDYDIIKICDTRIALIYRNNSGSGNIKVLSITNNGNNIFCSAPFEFDNQSCYEPNVVRVFGDTYAIAYADNNRDGAIKTVEITPDGIIHQVISTYIFDSINDTYYPNIKHISENKFVITYHGKNGNQGFLATVEIADNGTITPKVFDTLKYEDDICKYPKIIHMVDDFFVVAYEGTQQDGFALVVKIDQNGFINDTICSKFKFNDGFKNLQGDEPDIIKVSEYVYAIAFHGGSNAAVPQNGMLLTFSLLDDIDPYIPPNNRGVIYKQDTWGIYVNKTHVVATIGISIFSQAYALSNTDWNHLVLTYDGSYIRLFCNDTLVINEFYDIGIKSDLTKPIFIGKLFHGYIDHVCIYETLIK